MGWPDVAVLAETGSETGFPAPVILGPVEQPALSIDAAALADLLVRAAATVIDLSSSRAFRDGHIPNAWFAIRARLDRALPRINPRGTLVLTSEDGVLACLACEEAAALAPVPVRYLAGGNRAWAASGRFFVRGEDNMADEAIDLWLKPYDLANGVKDAMAEYLAWEIDLVHRIARDGTLKFAGL
jgi:rhodanese-related sulfurtransferase